MKLLCLSNGHGEDAIALRILTALRQLQHPPTVAALPIVGKGQTYAAAGIPIVGSVKAMPSGGFIYMDGKQLVRDVQGGLVQLTRDQFQTVRQWGRDGGCILAVGDIVPLLFAWLSGVPYAFVGTAKSEYYLRDEAGPVPRLSWFDQLENWSGSVYLPWERWLMSRPRCRAVIPRDTITTHTLQQWRIPAYDLGNPMMDGLEPTGRCLTGLPIGSEALTILLMPGSRAPEAHRNWQLILTAVDAVRQTLRDRPLLFLAAIAPSLDIHPFIKLLTDHRSGIRWSETRPVDPTPTIGHEFTGTIDPTTATTACTTHLILTQTAFSDCLHQAEMAIALAGTATEQFVGLGKPAITIPGDGPQFTPAFAEAQTRLLGPSILLVPHPEAVGGAIASLLANPEQRERIRHNGLHRMGSPGAAERIARCLVDVLA